MPEGDTLFRIATTLRKALLGARVTRFASARLRGSPEGQRIEEVVARGKNLLVRFEKGRTLRTHLMLRGAWHLYREGERWHLLVRNRTQGPRTTRASLDGGRLRG